MTTLKTTALPLLTAALMPLSALAVPVQIGPGADLGGPHVGDTAD